jgi:hypothetical protein
LGTVPAKHLIRWLAGYYVDVDVHPRCLLMHGATCNLTSRSTERPTFTSTESMEI